MRKEFTPHPNVYFVYGLLARPTVRNSAALKSQVQGGTLPNGPWRMDLHHVFAAALRSPVGQLTLAVVNDAQTDWDWVVSLYGPPERRTWYRYQITPKQRDRIDLRMESDKEFSLFAEKMEFADHLPARSVAVYTTYRLAHDDVGAPAE